MKSSERKRQPRRDRIDALEKQVWRAAREENIPLPTEGLEKQVLARIDREKSGRASGSLLDAVGLFAWRMVPAAAAVLILVAAFGTFRPSPAANQWLVLFSGGDKIAQWIITGG